jgi:hypothetical protein
MANKSNLEAGDKSKQIEYNKCQKQIYIKKTTNKQTKNTNSKQ